MSQLVEYKGEKFKDFVKNHRVIDENTKLYRKITVEEVAEMLDVSRNQVYKYFNSKSLDDKVVVRIMRAFEVGVEDIWGNPKDTLREPAIEYGHSERQLNPVVDYRDELLKALLKNQELQNEIDSLREELNNIKSLHQRNGTA